MLHEIISCNISFNAKSKIIAMPHHNITAAYCLEMELYLFCAMPEFWYTIDISFAAGNIFFVCICCFKFASSWAFLWGCFQELKPINGTLYDNRMIDKERVLCLVENFSMKHEKVANLCDWHSFL